ncbi:MAG TPA: tetratricopeptide repeat protein, partial [Chthoniobacterales bacterium]
MELAWRAWWKKVLESKWSAVAALVVIEMAAYWPALNAGFIWNDDDYLTGNQTSGDLSGLRDIWFKIGRDRFYYPLVQTISWLEYHIWGLNPFGYHLANVLLHALTAILVWRVLRQLAVPGALLAAALFALHPVQVESVAWIAQRKVVLSAVFYLAAALTYLRFTQLKDTGASGGRRWSFYLLALLLFVAALLSETITASLPAALLLIRWWKKARIRWSDITPLVPFFLLGVASGLVTDLLEKHYGRMEAMVRYLAFPQHLLLAGKGIWFYIGKLLWPSRLTFIYPYWILDVKQWWQWGFPIWLVAAVAVLWYARHRIGRAPFVALLFFAATLAPVVGLLNAHPLGYAYVADHFLYLASIGLLALAAAGLSRLPRVTWLGLLGIVGFLTWQQTHIYRDSETLWRDTLTKNPGSWVSHNNFGIALLTLGKVEEAIPAFQWSIERHPDLKWSYDNLGRAYLQQGRVNDGIACFQKACDIHLKDAAVCHYLGNAVLKGEVDQAILSYQKALETKPNYAQAEYNLAVTLEQEGEIDQ